MLRNRRWLSLAACLHIKIARKIRFFITRSKRSRPKAGSDEVTVASAVLLDEQRKLPKSPAAPKHVCAKTIRLRRRARDRVDREIRVIGFLPAGPGIATKAKQSAVYATLGGGFPLRCWRNSVGD